MPLSSHSPPRVSVLMAVHNGERFLRQAIDSVLVQTLSDWEFVIIDDASSDNSAQILASYDDARIVVLRNEQNLGLTKSLNVALRMARGHYIARMDGDDVCEAQRLQTQADYLDEHPQIDVLASSVDFIDENSAVVGGRDMDFSQPIFAWLLTWTNLIIHPSVMMSRQRLGDLGGFDEQFRYAQDQELWSRVLMRGGKFAFLPQRLLRYRWSDTQIWKTKRGEQQRCAQEINRAYIQHLLGEEVSSATVAAMQSVMLQAPDLDNLEQLQAALELAQRIRQRCERDCSRQEAHEIQARTFEILMLQAKAAAGRHPQAAKMLLHGALQIAPRFARKRSVWLLQLRLLKPVAP